MRWLAIQAILAYQRFVSPYKGFCCAYRAQTGRCCCSEFGRRAVARKGVLIGLLLIDARLQRCGQAHRVRRLRGQRGVLHCDLPDVSGPCDPTDSCDASQICSCADACSPGCDGCDWRSRRKQQRGRNVQIKAGRWPEGDTSNQR